MFYEIISFFASRWSGAELVLSVVCVCAVGMLIRLWIKCRKLQRDTRILSSLPIRLAVFDRDGKVLFFHRESGLAPTAPDEQYCQYTDFPWLASGDFDERLRKVCDSGNPESWDYDFYGEKRSAILTRLDEKLFGRPVVLSVSSDSSRLQQARAEARANADRFLLTLQSLGNSVIVTDATGRLVLMNRAAARLTGCDPDAAKGAEVNRLLQLYSLLNGEKVSSSLDATLETGEYEQCTTPRLLLDSLGQKHVVTSNTSPLKDENGVLTGAILVFQDITTEQQQQSQIRENQALLYKVCAHLSMTFFRLNLTQGGSTPLLPGVRFRPEDENGTQYPLDRWLTPDSLQALHENLDALRSRSKTEFQARLQSDCQGIRRTYMIYCVRLDELQSSECLGVLRDISREEQRKNEHDNTLTLFHSIINSIPLPIFTKDINDHFRYLTVNDAFADQLGIASAEAIGKSDYELLADPADAEDLRKHDEALLAAGGAITSFEENYRMTNGKRYFSNAVKQIIELRGGRRILLGISLDITAEHIAKQKAEQSLKLLWSILNAIPANIYVKDHTDHGRYIFRNEAALRNFRNGATHPEYPAVWHQTIVEQDLAAAQSWKTEHRTLELFNANGEATLNEISKKAILSPEGHTLLVAQAVDISERIRQKTEQENIQAELNSRVRNAEIINRCLTRITGENDFAAEMEAMLRTIAEALGTAHCYIFERNPADARFLYRFEHCAPGVSPRSDANGLDRMPGAESILSRNQEIVIENLRDMPPEFAEWELAEKLQSLFLIPIFREGKLESILGGDFSGEPRRLPEPDLQLLRDAAALYSVAQDRAERRSRLLDERNLNAQMFAQVKIPLLLLDHSLNVISVNASACTLFRRKREKLIGKPCMGSFCPMPNRESCLRQNCPLRETQETGREIVWENSVRDRTLRIQTTPIFRTGEDSVQYILTSILDITADRDKEEALHRSRIQLETEKQQLQDQLAQDRTLNRCLEVLLHESGELEATRQIVAVIGNQLNAGCVLLFEYRQDGPQPVFHRSESWIATDSNHDVTDINEVPEVFYEHVYAELKSGRPVPLHRSDPMTADDPVWKIEVRQYLDWAKQEELILVPIFDRHRFYGYLGMEHSVPNQRFGESGLNLMRGGARVIEILRARVGQHLAADLNLLEKHELLRAIPYPLAILDAEGKIQEANAAAAAILKHPEAELKGLPGYLLYRDPDTPPADDDPLNQALATASGQTQTQGEAENRVRIRVVPLLEAGRTAKLLLSLHPEPHANSTPAPEPEPPIEGPTILVVDDVLLNVRVLAAMLRKLHYRVLTATSGAEALKLLKSEPVTILMTDLWMPLMNGAELAGEARREHPRGLRIMAVTADIECRKNFDLTPFDGLLLKPVTVDKIRQTIS